MGIETEALAEMRGYSFPGNHRELSLIIDRAVAGAHGLRLTLTDLSIGRLAANSGDDPLAGSMEEVERRVLLHALSRAGGNKSEAARLLGLPRTTLLDKLRRHKLDEASHDTRGLN
jgi:transcriptional regulator of acetoin/glycerol metabolism